MFIEKRFSLDEIAAGAGEQSQLVQCLCHLSVRLPANGAQPRECFAEEDLGLIMAPLVNEHASQLPPDEGSCRVLRSHPIAPACIHVTKHLGGPAQIPTVAVQTGQASSRDQGVWMVLALSPAPRFQNPVIAGFGLLESAQKPIDRAGGGEEWMAETFSGIVEIQESSGGVTRIVINGDASTVTVGSAGQAGTLVLQNAQGQNTMLLDTVVRPVIEQPAGAGDPAAAAGHAPMVVGDVYCSVTSVTLTTPF